MQDLNDKVTGGDLLATEWNELPSEIQNIIEAFGIVLSSGDLNQLGKGIANYVLGGQHFINSGTADAAILSVVGSRQAPSTYVDGMKITYKITAPNTGTVTVNVANLGVRNLKYNGGGALLSGELDTEIAVEAIYHTAAAEFRLINQKGSTQRSGHVLLTDSFGQSTTLGATQKLATSANNNAVAAQSTADGAQSDATQALADAATADGKAVTADGKADSAQSTADGAVSVNDAQTIVINANTNQINTNTSNIATAQSAADSAQSTADSAMSKSVAGNITAEHEWQDDVKQLFGDGADVSVSYSATFGLTGGLVTDIGNQSWGLSNGVNPIILYSSLTKTLQFSSDTSQFMEGLIPRFVMSYGAANENLAHGRIELGEVDTGQHWLILGVPQQGTGLNAGLRGLFIERALTGALSEYLEFTHLGTVKARIDGNGNVQGTGAYTTLSDIGTKTNIKDLKEVVDSAAIIKGLIPRRFDHKEEFGGSIDQDGFVSHEVAKVLPGATPIFDDGIRTVPDLDSEGELQYASVEDKLSNNFKKKTLNTGKKLFGVQETKIIPHLVSVLQDQMDVIESLTARLDALEN